MIDAAIVGIGWWGKILVESVQGNSGRIRFVRGVTKDRPACSAFARRHGLQLCDDLDDVLRDPDIDAVVIATPHSLHVDQVRYAAQAGKHVFCEKPLALQLADAFEAVRACERAGVVLALGNDKRFLPAVRELKRVIADGALGTLIHVEGQYSNDNISRDISGAWRALASEAPGGGMTGPGLHVIDGLINLAGPLRRVTARLYQPFSESASVDAVAALLEFAGGVSGTLGCVRGVPEFFRFHAFGTRGWAEVRGFDTLLTVFSDGASELRSFQENSGVADLLEAFAQAIIGEAAFPVSTASMLDTVAAFEATIASLIAATPVQVRGHSSVIESRAGRD